MVDWGCWCCTPWTPTAQGSIMLIPDGNLHFAPVSTTTEANWCPHLEWMHLTYGHFLPHWSRSMNCPFKNVHAEPQERSRARARAHTHTHSPFISQQSLMPLWSTLIGSCSSDFRLVMEVRWPPWAPTPAGLLAPKWGLVAPAGRSGGKSWVRGLDITSGQKEEGRRVRWGGRRWEPADC